MLFPSLDFKEENDQLELIITPGQRAANIFMLVFLTLLIAGIDFFAFWFYFYHCADAFSCFFAIGLFTFAFIIVSVIMFREGLNREIIRVDKDNLYLITAGPLRTKFSSRYPRSAIFDFTCRTPTAKGVFQFTYENEVIRFGRNVHAEDVQEAYETMIKFFNRCGYITIYTDDEVIEPEVEEI